MTPIIDLHCDLLGCVQHDEKKLNFDSPEINCSVPQLQEGNVQLQVFAVAAMTKEGTTRAAERQVELYKELRPRYRGLFAIENASALVEEDEHLDRTFERFEAFQAVEDILYVSLTWNDENRFGGGNDSKAGLKPDGKVLLDYLVDKDVFIDLSHTSDALAHDILNYVDGRVIASHSNYRACSDIARNLPDDIAREIFRRGGLVGLNFVRRFVGDDRRDFLKHIHHAINLGGENSICLGADFYGGIDLSFSWMTHPTFQEEFSNASCYQRFLDLLREEFSEEIVQKIAYQNAMTSSKISLSPV